MAECLSIVWTDHILFILLPVDGHSGCFHFAGIMNNAAMNTLVPVSVWTYVSSSLRCTPRSGIAESYGNSIVNLLRNCQSVSKVAAPLSVLTRQLPL